MSPELQRFFASMERLFAEPSQAAAVHAAHPDFPSPLERLSVYGRFVEGHITSALRKIYPVTVAALGERFGPLAARYYRTRPARHFEPNRAAEAFVAFLADHARDLPEHLEPLARFEWTDFAVYASEAEAIPLPLAEAPSVNPTLVVLQHPFRLCAYLATSPGQRPAAPEPSEELALLWRDPQSLRTTFVAADPTRLLALKLVVEGLSVEAAAAQSGADPGLLRSALRQAEREGFIHLPPDYTFQ